MFFKSEQTSQDVDQSDKRSPFVKCDKIFTTKQELKIHFKECHSAVNNQKLALKVGRKKRKIKKFRCRICKLSFTSENLLESHVTTDHHEELPGIKCEFCMQRFATDYEIAQHIEAVHSDEYPCPICSQYFNSNDDLDEHLDSEHADYKTDDEHEHDEAADDDDDYEEGFNAVEAILGC